MDRLLFLMAYISIRLSLNCWLCSEILCASSECRLGDKGSIVSCDNLCFNAGKNDVTKKNPKYRLLFTMFSILNIGKIIADNNPGIALVTSSWNSIYARSITDKSSLDF